MSPLKTSLTDAYVYVVWVPPMSVCNDLPLYWTGHLSFEARPRAVMSYNIKDAEIFKSADAARFFQILSLGRFGAVKTITALDKKVISGK
jgi:hypothetical protein